MAEGLSRAERYFQRIESLALSALPINELPLRAAAPTHHDGVMVALVPEMPERLALDHPDALSSDDLHVTLCYLGKVDALSSADQSAILAKARSVCDAVGHAFSTSADGVVVMGKSDDGVPATALLVQSDDIVDLYHAMAEALNYQSKFPSFIPHMTTGYGVPAEMAQERVGQPIDFDNVLVKFGDDRHIIPLRSGLVAAPKGANVIDRVIDSLGRLWDEALHPRDGEGKFIKKNGAVSGLLSVPSGDGSGVKQVPANRASVVGFHTFDDEVWVLAEIEMPDGTKQQGFAKATDVKAVAPVKARLDALYPVSNGDDFAASSLERQRQLDLLLAHINEQYGPSDDGEGALSFIETLGLWEKDLEYMMPEEPSGFLDGIRKIDQPLSADDRDELEDIINDAKLVKELRDRVHQLKEDSANPWFSHDELDAFLSSLFGESPLDVKQERHPRTGRLVDVGIQRNVFHPEKGQEGPAVFSLTDHGEFPNRPTFPEKVEDTEPIKFVYRGMSMDEWNQAQERGYIQSDKRGVIADWEGTNAAVDPRSAVSYLPRNGDGVLVQIAVDDSDDWFTINSDGYLRTRSQIPLERVTTTSPILTKEDGTLMKPEGAVPSPDDLVHVPPTQRLVTGDGPDQEAVDALNGGADPLEVPTSNLIAAMDQSSRFSRKNVSAATGVSPIWWYTDPSDDTGVEAGLAGTGTSTTERAFFVKESIVGAELGNTDIVREVLASLIFEQISESVGSDDPGLLPVPKSVFGDNPEWDGGDMQNKGAFYTHQPGHVVSQHGAYLIDSDMVVTDAVSEEVAFRNDIKDLDEVQQQDQRSAFNEDMGNLYGNDIAKMVLWDFAILNSDRNSGNALLASSPDGTRGSVVPIDHGFAFDDDPFYKKEDFSPGIQGTFEWFTQYQLTQAWLDYLRGGVDLGENVTNDTVRDAVEAFTNAYKGIDAGSISAAFQSLPGVTQEQIEYVDGWLTGVVDRLTWMGDNMDSVLSGLLTGPAV